MFVKKEKTFSDSGKIFTAENRYSLYYLGWLLFALFITSIINLLLVDDYFNFISQASLLTVLIIVCLPTYRFIQKFLKNIPFIYLKLVVFTVIYLAIAGYFIFYKYCYGYITFRHMKVYLKLPFLEINDQLLSSTILIYLDLITILIFGLLPVFLTIRFTGHNKSDNSQVFNKKISKIFNYNLFQYSKRLIPLMKTVLQEKITTIVLGIVINSAAVIFLIILIFSDIQVEKYYELGLLRWTFVTFTTWLSSLAAFTSPFLMGLTMYLEDTIVKTYIRKLKHTIDSLENHTVVIGYGDLGKRTVNEIEQIIKENTLNSDNKIHYILIPNVNLDFVALRRDIIIVDRSENVFRFVHSTMPDIKIGVTQNAKGDEFFPTLVGDVNFPSTLELTKVLQAKLIVNVAKDKKSTFSIISFTERKNNEKKPNLLLSFHGTADKSYLITRGIDIGKYYIYPAQVSGILLGDRLYAFYRKELYKNCLIGNIERIPTDKMGKILIIGDGKQLFFVIESIWIGIKEYFDNEPNEIKNYFKQCVYAFADSEYLQKHVNKKLDVCQFSIPRAITPYNESIRNNLNYTYLDIPISHGSSINLIDLENAILKIRPKYVLISFEESERTLDVLHEMLVIAERQGWNIAKNENLADKPFIIVNTREKEKTFVKDVLFYWAKEQQKDSYPMQYPDGIVNFYEGTRGMIRGIVASVLGTSEKYNSEGKFEISLCLSNISGATSTMLTSMAGLSIDGNINEDIINVPSFLNFDNRNMGKDKWCFNAQVILVSPHKEVLEKEVLELDDILRSYLINADKHTRKKIKNILKTKNNVKIDGPPLSCPGRQVCSMYTYSRRYKSDLERKNRAKHKTSQKIIENLEKYVSSKNAILPLTEKPDKIGEVIICGSGDRPGSLAKVLNKLLFKNTREIRSNNDNERININYIQSFTCYDRRFKYHKIYGELTKIDNNVEFNINEILNACLIFPITCHYEWWVYAVDLYISLNENNKNKYRLFFDKKDEPTRFLLLESSLIKEKQGLVFNNDRFSIDLRVDKIDAKGNCNSECFFSQCGASKNDCKLMDCFYYSDKIKWKEFHKLTKI